MNEHVRMAENWLLECVQNGLAHSYDTVKNVWVKPYPEVTGYLMSYFATHHGEIPKSIDGVARKLLAVQDLSGGYPSFRSNDKLFTFDTAQIMHGFLRLYDRTGSVRFLNAAVRCGEFVLKMQVANGAMYPIYEKKNRVKIASKKTWGTSFSGIQVKNIEGLLMLRNATGEGRYGLSAAQLCVWGKQNFNSTHTHPAAYFLEGMLAIGEEDFVKNELKEKFIGRVNDNGYIAYEPGLPYAYVSGSMQLGILFLKTGFIDEAKKILRFGRQIQQYHRGGLFQYADEDSRPVLQPHGEINSWGTKYFCELERLFMAMDSHNTPQNNVRRPSH